MNKMNGKFYAYSIAIGLVAIIIFFFLFRRQGYKLYIKKCNTEKDLGFEGVVSNYSTNIKDETSSFNLDSSKVVYVIPRSSKELHLDDGDTIKKPRGQNVYFIRRYLPSSGNHLDTFIFDCNNIR